MLRSRVRRHPALIAGLFSVLLAFPLAAGEVDLADLSLEELMDVEVSSVAKKEGRLSDSAAAVYVITREDIRRSGVGTIADSLRLAPGMQVSQLNANQWAISARGFADLLANKMLVVVDGRSVYTPLFGGVYWNQQDMLLEDIERIEIIRGPGATLWGANAVNGVINITTRRVADTEGGVAELAAGSHDRPVAGVRYAGKMGQSSRYRVFGKYFDREPFLRLNGDRAADGWETLRGGARFEFDLEGGGRVTVQAEAFDGTAGQTIQLPLLVPSYSGTADDTIDHRGSHVLGRWEFGRANRTRSSLQVYFDQMEHSEALYGEDRWNLDVEFEQSRDFPGPHEIVWGILYRHTDDEMIGTTLATAVPPTRKLDLYSAFLQDDIDLASGKVRLTVGSKFEHNDFTGFEVQPNVRALWRLDEGQALWGAVSRAVRTPSRVFTDARVNIAAFPDLNSGTTFLVSIFGNPEFDSEDLLAWEVGYRRFASRWSLDVVAFYNDYSNLATIRAETPFPEIDPLPPHLVIPQVFGNEADGRSVGVEVSSNWSPVDRWRMTATYSFIDLEITVPDDPTVKSVANAYAVPSHQVGFRSFWDVTERLELDGLVQYVDEISPFGGFNQPVPIDAFTRVDLRLGWHALPSLDVNLGVRNLLEEAHVEWVDTRVRSSQIERTWYAGLLWKF